MRLDERVTRLDERLTSLEERFREHTDYVEGLRAHDAEIDALKERVERLEQRGDTA